mgnify:CR=1 FL=1
MSAIWFYVLYFILAAGAAGVYCLLPSPARRARSAGTILLLAALAALLVFGGRALGWGGGRDFYFCAFGALALFGAIRVVTHVRPVYSALYFIVVVLSIAGLLVLADATFLAAALVIVYAGAILVTYIFVIMLAQQSDAAVCDRRASDPVAAVMVAFVLVACIGGMLGEGPRALDAAPIVAAGAAGLPASPVASADAAVNRDAGNVRALGRTLLTRYAVAIEVAGVLLLVAMVGAIWLARRPIPVDAAGATTEKPLGQIGREVPPF